MAATLAQSRVAGKKRGGAIPFFTQQNRSSIVILMADDNEDDFLLTKRAFQKNKIINPLFHVKDGRELLDYLERRGPYSDVKSYPTPGLVLLDLNMPGMDGRTALNYIKESESLRIMPIVVMTTSALEEDIARSYDLGVSSYIRKPVEVADFIAMIGKWKDYWLDVVELPKLE